MVQNNYIDTYLKKVDQILECQDAVLRNALVDKLINNKEYVPKQQKKTHSGSVSKTR